MIDAELAARRAIEDAGYHVHDANVIFGANCPNIDLVAYGKSSATYVQVKGTKRAAGKDCIIVDGSPWTEEQLHGRAPVYNKHDGLVASHVVLVDLSIPMRPNFLSRCQSGLRNWHGSAARNMQRSPSVTGRHDPSDFERSCPKPNCVTAAAPGSHSARRSTELLAHSSSRTLVRQTARLSARARLARPGIRARP